MRVNAWALAPLMAFPPAVGYSALTVHVNVPVPLRLVSVKAVVSSAGGVRLSLPVSSAADMHVVGDRARHWIPLQRRNAFSRYGIVYRTERRRRKRLLELRCRR